MVKIKSRLILGCVGVLLSSAGAFAAPLNKINTKVDCSNSAEGTVIVTSSGTRSELVDAILLANACFEKDLPAVIRAHQQAAKELESTDDVPRDGEPSETSTLLLSEWLQGRPACLQPDGSKPATCSLSGEATYVVRTNYRVSGIGTGRFDGVISSVTIKLSAEEQFVFERDGTNMPDQQTIVVRFQGLINLE